MGPTLRSHLAVDDNCPFAPACISRSPALRCFGERSGWRAETCTMVLMAIALSLIENQVVTQAVNALLVSLFWPLDKAGA